MANGDFDWTKNELPKLEKFFSMISDVLENFADANNLRIEKYYHDLPGWEFLFRHPCGGACYIEISKKDKNNVTIYGDWWIDIYDTGKRFDKHTEKQVCSINSSELKQNLSALYTAMLSWNIDDLIMPDERNAFENWKKTFSKEEFERLNEQFPIPKID